MRQICCQIIQKICRNTDVFQKFSVQYDGKDVVQAGAKGEAGGCAVLPLLNPELDPACGEVDLLRGIGDPLIDRAHDLTEGDLLGILRKNGKARLDLDNDHCAVELLDLPHTFDHAVHDDLADLVMLFPRDIFDILRDPAHHGGGIRAETVENEKFMILDERYGILDVLYDRPLDVVFAV